MAEAANGQANVLCELSGTEVEALRSWSFDALGVAAERHVAFLAWMFLDLGIASATDKPAGSGALTTRQHLHGFLQKAHEMYHQVPYHNAHHMLDVTQFLYRLILSLRDSLGLKPIEQFALMVAAVVHDLDHPGLSGDFLARSGKLSSDGVAAETGSEALLEQHHLDTFFQLLQQHQDCDLLGRLAPDLRSEAAAIIRHAVLMTCVAFHGQHIAQAEALLRLVADRDGHSANGTVPDAEAAPAPLLAGMEGEQRLPMLSLLLHTADLSGAAKPFSISLKWACRICTEYLHQGDRERLLGMPVSPNMDRARTHMPYLQATFLDRICSPMYAPLARAFPQLRGIFRCLAGNLEVWSRVCQCPEDVPEIAGAELVAPPLADAAPEAPAQQQPSLPTPRQQAEVQAMASRFLQEHSDLLQ